MTIAATHFIRSAAFRVADLLKTNETLMTDIDSNIAAIEEGKRSALTVLADIESIEGFDFEALPKVGSEAPKAGNTNQQVFDWYVEADGTQGRFYYDIADRLKPGLVALKKAFQEFDKSKTDNKDELAKALPSKDDEAFFRTFQHGTDEVTRMRKKYERRYTSLRDMTTKAFQVQQIVTRLNNLSSVSCRIERAKDGGYDQSPSPVVFDNAPAHLADKTGTPFKRVLWSIGTLLLLERAEKNEKGEALVNYTRLDNAIAQGGTYETILKCVERDTDGKNASKGADIRSLKAATPEEFMAVTNVITAYGYDVKEGNWAIREKAETRLLAALKGPNKEADRELVFKLFEMLDSLTSKLEKERAADLDKVGNKEVAA